MPHFARDSEPPWMSSLRLAEGVQEVYGPEEHHPLILEMQRALGPGVEDDETAWCSSAIAWSFRQCGMCIPEGVTRAARSWLQADGLRRLSATPPCGAIAVLWRGSRDSWQGHVGLVHDFSANGHYVNLLGGNQRNSVCVLPYAIDRVLGYMWPRNFDPGSFQL